MFLPTYSTSGSEFENKETLRGVKRGDIWGPHMAGSNKLQCGAHGNNNEIADKFGIRDFITVGACCQPFFFGVCHLISLPTFIFVVDRRAV